MQRPARTEALPQVAAHLQAAEAKVTSENGSPGPCPGRTQAKCGVGDTLECPDASGSGSLFAALQDPPQSRRAPRAFPQARAHLNSPTLEDRDARSGRACSSGPGGPRKFPPRRPVAAKPGARSPALLPGARTAQPVLTRPRLDPQVAVGARREDSAAAGTRAARAPVQPQD